MPTPEARGAALQTATERGIAVQALFDGSLEAGTFVILRQSDLAEALDRFAAQRGAEADARRAPGLYEMVEKYGGAPPQTGGGDAPRLVIERGRAGLWYATSPDIPGLLASATTFAELDQAIPKAIADLKRAAPPTEAALQRAALSRALDGERLATEEEDTTDQGSTIAQTGGGDALSEEECEAALDAYIDAGSLLTTDAMRAALIGARKARQTGGGDAPVPHWQNPDDIAPWPYPRRHRSPERQTGGGDAGEQMFTDPKDIASAFVAIIAGQQRELVAKSDRDYIATYLASIIKIHMDRSRREGAEAMRSASMGAVDAEEELEGEPPQAAIDAMLDDPPAFLRGTVRATKHGIRNRISALPIPGKTDAG